MSEQIRDEMEISTALYGMTVVLYNPNLPEPKVLSRQEMIDLGKHMEENTYEAKPLPEGVYNPITEFLKNQKDATPIKFPVRIKWNSDRQIVDAEDNGIALCMKPSQAALIVHRVNTWEGMLELLRKAKIHLSVQGDQLSVILHKQISEAINLAEGKECK